MRVVIVGATGNAGSSLVDELERSGAVDEIVGLARRLPAPARAAGKRTTFHSADIVRDDPELSEVIDMIKNGFFSPEDRTLFHDLVNGLLTSDPYMVLADYRSYQEVRLKALNAYRDPNHWQQMAIRNVAGSGPFSSDRTIREYARDIWKIDPVPVDVPVYSPE